MKKTNSYIVAICSASCVFIIACTKDENGSDSVGNGNSGNNYALIDPTNCWHKDSLTSTEVLSIFLYVDSGPQKNHFFLESYQGPCLGPPPFADLGIGSSDASDRISFTLDSKVHYGLIADTAGYKRMIVRCPQDSSVSFYYSD